MVKPYMNSSEPPIYIHTVCIHIVTYIMYIYTYVCVMYEKKVTAVEHIHKAMCIRTS